MSIVLVSIEADGGNGMIGPPSGNGGWDAPPKLGSSGNGRNGRNDDDEDDDDDNAMGGESTSRSRTNFL